MFNCWAETTQADNYRGDRVYVNASVNPVTLADFTLFIKAFKIAKDEKAKESLRDDKI